MQVPAAFPSPSLFPLPRPIPSPVKRASLECKRSFPFFSSPRHGRRFAVSLLGSFLNHLSSPRACRSGGFLPSFLSRIRRLGRCFFFLFHPPSFSSVILSLPLRVAQSAAVLVLSSPPLALLSFPEWTVQGDPSPVGGRRLRGRGPSCPSHIRSPFFLLTGEQPLSPLMSDMQPHPLLRPSSGARTILTSFPL